MQSIRGMLMVAAAFATSGCVMAVRHAAKEINRSEAEARSRKAYPVGTAVEAIRTAMVSHDYACADMSAARADGFRMLCRPLHAERTAGTFLFGGNWRLEFSGRNGRLEHVKAIAGARRS